MDEIGKLGVVPNLHLLLTLTESFPAADNKVTGSLPQYPRDSQAHSHERLGPFVLSTIVLAIALGSGYG